MSEQVQADQVAAPTEMPKTIEINGVTYRREADWMDKVVNEVLEHRLVAVRAGISLKQAVWFARRDDSPMPD